MYLTCLKSVVVVIFTAAFINVEVLWQRCSVVVLVHGDTNTSTGEATGLEGGGKIDRRREQQERREFSAVSLVQELDYTADVVITVDPLSTGLAVDVHGQVTTFAPSQNFSLHLESHLQGANGGS